MTMIRSTCGFALAILLAATAASAQEQCAPTRRGRRIARRDIRGGLGQAEQPRSQQPAQRSGASAGAARWQVHRHQYAAADADHDGLRAAAGGTTRRRAAGAADGEVRHYGQDRRQRDAPPEGSATAPADIAGRPVQAEGAHRVSRAAGLRPGARPQRRTPRSRLQTLEVRLRQGRRARWPSRAPQSHRATCPAPWASPARARSRRMRRVGR